jgi:hypothetical protein
MFELKIPGWILLFSAIGATLTHVVLVSMYFGSVRASDADVIHQLAPV